MVDIDIFYFWILVNNKHVILDEGIYCINLINTYIYVYLFTYTNNSNTILWIYAFNYNTYESFTHTDVNFTWMDIRILQLGYYFDITEQVMLMLIKYEIRLLLI